MATTRLLLSLALLAASAQGWTRWEYNTQWSTGGQSKVLTSMLQFYATWGKNASVGSTPRANAQDITKDSVTGQPKPGPNFKSDQNAPRPRRGHSLVSILTSTKSLAYEGYTYVFMFGGRDNDDAAYEHIPKTYSVKKINGTIQFETYDQKPVDPCNDKINPSTGKYRYYTDAQVKAANCKTDRTKITVGIIYNDVWAYRMCERRSEPYASSKLGDLKANPNDPLGGSTPDFTVYPNRPPEPSDPLPRNGGRDARYFDSPCVQGGWVNINAGAPEGGCVIQLGILVCTHPSERYSHGTAMFNDGLMYIYGGFSQRCADYCDDLWVYDIYQNSWRQLYCSVASGGGCKADLSHLFTDVLFDTSVLYDYRNSPAQEVPLTLGPRDSNGNDFPWAGPGQRWRHAMMQGDEYNCSNVNAGDVLGFEAGIGLKKACEDEVNANKGPLPCTKLIGSPSGRCQDMAIFGGHRLWQGYDVLNSDGNYWRDYSLRAPGGYLSDLWIYTKSIDTATTAGQGFHTTFGHWRKAPQIEETDFDGDRNDWINRDRKKTYTIWPSERAGAGLAVDTPRNLIWLHGGYATYFPYLSTDGPGSGPGPTARGIGGFIPYPGYPHFKNDLWQYNISSGLWRQIAFKPDDVQPEGRTDHVFLLIGEVLFLHGGYGDNNYFDDTWYFNITTSRWLRKERFVYPEYPAACTDDIEFIKQHTECVRNSFPKPLDRSTTVPFSILPYIPGGQEYYWPDQRHGPYFKPFPRGSLPDNTTFFGPGNPPDIPGPFSPKPGTGAWSPPGRQQGVRLDVAQTATLASASTPATGQFIPAIGEPQAPYSAIGPMESVRAFLYWINSSSVATLYESCTSVYGEPTRGMVTDGLAGRANFSVFVPQPRRQRPGWDGCRNRYDGRTDLPLVLAYQRPTPRAGHRAVWLNDTNEIIMYGGMAYLSEQPKSTNYSYETKVMDDMWYFNIYHCINNCSNHGICYFGFCQCYVGYYGEDCSNTSCAGTSCYYDDYTHDQTCLHACQAGYNHTDNDTYVQDIAKLPCDPDPKRYGGAMLGESNGVCDGFGTVQCAPPFLGDDCGTRDCRSNCSFNGWCSIEYPVSRCMCQPGYFGNVCEHKMCLNNCSYPNGLCNHTTGFCMCHYTYSPYNNTRPYKPWEGEDCNWLWAYSAASPAASLGALYCAAVLGLLTTALLGLGAGDRGQREVE